jgi:hypothetical protein
MAKRKVENHLDSFAYRWCATYRWKGFDEGYNFVLDLISIGGLLKELWGLQSCKSPNFRNFGTPNLKVLGQNDIWVLAPWPDTKNTII